MFVCWRAKDNFSLINSRPEGPVMGGMVPTLIHLSPHCGRPSCTLARLVKLKVLVAWTAACAIVRLSRLKALASELTIAIASSYALTLSAGVLNCEALPEALKVLLSTNPAATVGETEVKLKALASALMSSIASSFSLTLSTEVSACEARPEVSRS